MGKIVYKAVPFLPKKGKKIPYERLWLDSSVSRAMYNAVCMVTISSLTGCFLAEYHGHMHGSAYI